MNHQVRYKLPLVLPQHILHVVAIVAACIAASAFVIAWYRADANDSIYYDAFWSPVMRWVLNLWPWATVLTLGVAGGVAGYIVHAALLHAAEIPAIQNNVAGEHNEIVGHFLGLVGVIYAVVLAFTVAIAWQSFEDSRHVAEREAHDVVSLFQVVNGHSNQHLVSHIRNLLRQYPLDLHDEWNAMMSDEKLCHYVTDRGGGACASIATTKDVRGIGGDIVQLKASNDGDAVVYSKSIDLFEDFTQARGQRRHYYSDRLLSSLWWSFVLGAIIVLLVSYLLVQQDPKTQRVRTIALGAMVGIMFSLILIFDHPFTGDEATSFQGSQWCGAVKYFSHELKLPQPHYKDC